MSLKIGLAGATGALGKEILVVLDEAPWRPSKVVALASPSTSVPFVEYGDQQVAVDDLETEAFEDLDALLLAVPQPVARVTGERAVAAGVPVIDCSGAFADDPGVPLIIPWVNPEALGEMPSQVVVAIPSPSATLLASALGVLRRAGVRGEVDATVFLPASVFGREGMEELSAQVIALFNQRTPPRRVFDHGLAFDLLPQVGSVDEDGWSEVELRAERELRRLTGLVEPMSITVVGVPLFSGISASVHLRTPQPVDPDLVARILGEGGAVLPKAVGPRYLPRPRRVNAEPFVHVGRVRRDLSGGGVHLWVSLDNLRGTAAIAVATAGAVLKRLGLLDS
jgi:aspartate-semialdehyde dehydrogenase